MVPPACPDSCINLQRPAKALWRRVGQGKMYGVSLYCPIKHLLFFWIEKLTKDSSGKYLEVNELLLSKWWEEANLRCCEDTDPHIPSSRQPQVLANSSHQQPPLLTLAYCMKNTPCVWPDLGKKLESTDLKANTSMFEYIFSIHHRLSHLPQRRLSSQGTPAFYYCASSHDTWHRCIPDCASTSSKQSWLVQVSLRRLLKGLDNMASENRGWPLA